MIKFDLNPNKVIETLVYLSSKKPNIDHYHMVKIIFYADKMHLNKYGRPILGDNYIKMHAGPVPSYVLDIINLNDMVVESEVLDKTINSLGIIQDYKRKLISPKRSADLLEFSDSDIECLDAAFEVYEKKTGEELYTESHKERAWIEADLNSRMNYELMVDVNNPMASDIIEDLTQSSNYMVI